MCFSMPPFTLFEVVRKVLFHTIKFIKSSFGKAPKVFYTINMYSFSITPLVLMVYNSIVSIITEVY